MLLARIRKRIKNFYERKKRRRHVMVGSPDLWSMKREFQISFLKRHGLSPDHKFLDVGCGTLRGGIPVLKYLNVGNYYGIDIREETITEARVEVQEEKLSLKQPNLFFFEDFSQLHIEQKFDLIWAFSVLIHMEDDILDKCLFFVNEHLEAGGRFFANVNLGERPVGSWRGFPVMGRKLGFYEDLAGRHKLSVRSLGQLSLHGHNSGNEEQDKQEMLEFQLEK